MCLDSIVKVYPTKLTDGLGRGVGWERKDDSRDSSTLLFGGEACGKSTLLDLFTGRPVCYPRGGATGTALSPHSFLCQIQGSSSEMLLAFWMKLLSLQDIPKPRQSCLIHSLGTVITKLP